MFLILVGVITQWVRKEVPESIKFADDIQFVQVKKLI